MKVIDKQIQKQIKKYEKIKRKGQRVIGDVTQGKGKRKGERRPGLEGPCKGGLQERSLGLNIQK